MELKQEPREKHATAAGPGALAMKGAAAAAVGATRASSNSWRLSLSAGPSRSPKPAPRDRRTNQLLFSALAVTLTALPWERLWTGAAPVSSPTRPPFLVGNGRLLGGLISVAFLLLWAAKVETEERLSAKARRKVARRLEASFNLPSTVGTSWLRVWISETVFGFGPVAVRAALAPGNKEIARRGQNGSGVANVLAIEWVLVRFQLTSFMPWSDVRRISHVRAGGMAIRVTEAVNSASARRNVRSSGSGPGQSEGNFRSTGDRSDSARRREGGNWSEQSQQEGEEENAARNDGETLSRINENEESLPRMGHEKKDLWAHGARQADQSSASPAASGSAKWNEDGFEWERVTQASLEYVLGHEFASKYKMYTEEAAGIIQRLSKIFFNLLKRYVIGEIVLQDMAVHLSPAVWRDLASAAIRWEGASVVRELLPAGGVEFRFDVTLSAQEMGCSSGSRTALEIVTALTKRTMLQLGRVVMWEARRAIFNNESLVHIFVDSLILEGRGRAKAAKPDASAIAVACKAESGAASGKATFIGVLGQGVSTVAKRKHVGEVLTVLRHALFKAITIAAGGLDPDECNQPLTSLLSKAEISERFELTVGESSPLLLGPVLKKDDEKEQEKDDVPGATRLRDPGVDDGGLRRLRRANNTRFRVKNRSGNLGRSNPGVGKGRCALDVESVDGTNETLGRNSRGVDRIGGAHGGRGDVGGIRTRGFRDEKGEAIAVAAKLAAVIRKQDKIAALNILRAVQVGPLLEELASSTAIGPALRKLKIDVDYILTHAKGMTFGTLLDQVIYQLEMAGSVGSQHLERLQGKASRDIIRLTEKAGMSSGAGGPPALSLDSFTDSMLAHAPGALGDAQKIAALAATFTRALASELTHDDLEATSTIFSILKGICARRAAANARAAAAAKAGSGGTGEGGGGTPPTAGEDPQKADKDAKARNEAWNLEAEVELISKDPAAMQSLRHVLERLAKLAKAGGVYVDVYFALSVLELAFGGLLQRIPKLLPVVQTTIKRKGVTIKISNLHLAGVDVPRNEIRFAFRGISLPPCGSIVETNTRFGRGRVLYYKKRSHSLCVELLKFPLTKGRHKFARAFVQPGDVVVVSEQDNVESASITPPITTDTPVATPRGVTASAAAVATSSSSAALGGPARPGLGTEASSDSTASTHPRATTKTLLASALQQLPGRFKQTGGDDGKRWRHKLSSLGPNVQPPPVRRTQHEAGGGLGHVEPSLADSDASFSNGARASSNTGGGDGDVGGTGDGNDTLAGALDDGGLGVNAAQVTGSTFEPSEEGWADGEESGVVSDSAGSPDHTGAESITSATVEKDIDQNRGDMKGSPRGGGTSSLNASTPPPMLRLGSTDAEGSGLEKGTGLADVRQPSPLPRFLRIPSATEISLEHPDTGGALASSRGQTSSVFIDEKRTEYYMDGAGGGGTTSSGISGPHKGGIDGSIPRSQTPSGTNAVGEHFPKEAANSTPKVISSGRDAWKKIAAVAAQGVGEASKGVPWVKKVAARGVGRGSGNRRQLRGQSRKEDDDPRETGKETSFHQGTYEGNGPGANDKAPLLSIQIGGVNGDLPDVQWSVQIQQKLLKGGDSGRVKVKVKGVSLSVSLDPGAGASSLLPLQRPPSAPSPQSSPTTATPQSSPFCREDDTDSLSRASSSPISVTPAGLLRQTSGLVDDDFSGGSAGRGAGQPQEGDTRDVGLSAGVEGVRDALGDTGDEVNDVTVTGDPSPPATDSFVIRRPPVSCTYASASGGAPASRDAGGPDFPDSATSVRPGHAPRLSSPVAEGSRGGLDTFPAEILLDNAPEGTRTAAYGGSGPRRATIKTLSSALTKGTDKLKRRLKGPMVTTTSSPLETPLCSPVHHDRSDGFTTPTPSTPTRPTPCQSPLNPEAASKAVKPLSEFVPVRDLFIGARKNDGGSREAGVERSRASPGVSDSSEDDKLACSIGYGSAGLLKVTECRCSVGTIDIQIDGSKYDGIYNFLAKGLGDTIRDAVREAVEKAFTQGVERLVARINDRAAQLWCGTAPEPKKPAKVVCSAIRAQDIGKGRIEPFVKLRLFDKDGSQVAKRITAALTSIAGAADASDRGGVSRNPCWIGLDNDLSLDLPEEGAQGYSLFFEVRHNGTLVNNLIGSTRRSTLREIEALVAEKRGENANIDPELCWDIDTGGKLMVRMSILGLAPLRSKKPSKVGFSDVSEITPAVDGDSSTISRRLA